MRTDLAVAAFLPTITNTITVAAGAALGLLFAARIADRYRTVLFQSIGLLTLVVGFKEALGTESLPILALSLILGGLCGEALQIEARLESLAGRLKRKIGREDDVRFVEGFVTSTLLFCVGTMTLVGCFDAAVKGDGELLYTKSIMDGTVAVFLAGAMGMGVLCSSGSVLVIQGVLTGLFLLLGGSLAFNVIGSDAVVREVSAAGGAVILGIGINLLELRHVRVANLIPAMIVAGLLASWWQGSA